MRYLFAFLFHTSSPEPSKYFTLTTWGNKNSPHFKCSRAPNGWWRPYWTVLWSFGKERPEKVGKGAMWGRFLFLLRNSKGRVKPPLAGFRLNGMVGVLSKYTQRSGRAWSGPAHNSHSSSLTPCQALGERQGTPSSVCWLVAQGHGVSDPSGAVHPGVTGVQSTLQYL